MKARTCLFLFFLSQSPLLAQNFSVTFNASAFSAEIPVPNYHLEGFSFSPVYSDETIRSKTLELAAFVFSAMIDGCDFTLIPNSNLNQVRQHFTYRLRGTVVKERIRIHRRQRLPETTTAFLSYPTDAFERRKRDLWNRPADLTSGGMGRASLRNGEGAQTEALTLAVKAAVIQAYQSTLLEKPRSVEGRLLFVEPPFFAIESGEWVAKVKIRLHTQEIVPYYR